MIFLKLNQFSKCLQSTIYSSLLNDSICVQVWRLLAVEEVADPANNYEVVAGTGDRWGNIYYYSDKNI